MQLCEFTNIGKPICYRRSMVFFPWCDRIFFIFVLFYFNNTYTGGLQKTGKRFMFHRRLFLVSNC